MSLALGYKHPDYLLSELSSTQWTEWKAYYNVEPFGHDIGFIMLSVLVSMYYNAHKAKGARTVKPTDFYNKLSLKSEKQSQEEMKATMMQLVRDTKSVKKKVPKKKRENKKNG